MPSRAEDAMLLEAAFDAIRSERQPVLDLLRYPETVLHFGACFVTLRVDDELRGCTGTLEPVRPLIEDVAHNAWSAAYRDLRFPPLARDEVDRVEVHLSILGPMVALQVSNEAELLALLEPGSDGLVLAEGSSRATFLPAVWQSLPDPREFVRQLERKAGLREGAWSAERRAWRYRVQEIAS